RQNPLGSEGRDGQLVADRYRLARGGHAGHRAGLAGSSLVGTGCEITSIPRLLVNFAGLLMVAITGPVVGPANSAGCPPSRPLLSPSALPRGSERRPPVQ